MPEVTVLRIEITEDSGKSESSLSNRDTGESLLAGDTNQIQSGSQSLDDTTLDNEESYNHNKMKQKTTASMKHSQKGFTDDTTAATKPKMITTSSVTKGIGATAALGASSYSLYSNYQKTGYELSGATHAAALQDRKGQAANTLLTIGVATVINPLLAAPVIAMKAWELSQNNRREIFEIRKSQIQSEVLQRNLVKNVAERRF